MFFAVLKAFAVVCFILSVFVTPAWPQGTAIGGGGPAVGGPGLPGAIGCPNCDIGVPNGDALIVLPPTSVPVLPPVLPTGPGSDVCQVISSSGGLETTRAYCAGLSAAERNPLEMCSC